MSKPVIAASRFGFGARPGDLTTISRDPQKWLLDQLQGPPRLHDEIQRLPDSASVLVAVQNLRRQQREENQNDADFVKTYGRTVRSHYVEQTNARYRAAAETDTPFHERLVHFWSNHFAVSADKQPIPAIAGLYEKEAIRPNVTGKFVDLLLAAEQHPAMIVYLDNQRYSQTGVKQGEAVLRDLASHPSTARHIATKLARHFIADDPPDSIVGKLSTAFLQSGGDLSACYAVLIQSEEAWTTVFSKYKTPHDFVVSTLRAFDHSPNNPRFITGALDLMGQAPYRPGSPAGWPDTAEHWGGADALYKRIEWSSSVSRFAGSRVNPVDLGDAVLGDAFNPETRKAISRAETLTQGMTLFLASPDFQRR